MYLCTFVPTQTLTSDRFYMTPSVLMPSITIICVQADEAPVEPARICMAHAGESIAFLRRTYYLLCIAFTLRYDAAPTGEKLDHVQASDVFTVKKLLHRITSQSRRTCAPPVRLSLCARPRDVSGENGWGLRDRCVTDKRLHRYRRMYQTRVSLIEVSIGP